MAGKDEQPEDREEQIAALKSIFAGSLASLGLALAFSFLIGLGFAAYKMLTGQPVADWLRVGSWLVVFGGIVIGDPVSAYREGKSKKIMALKMLGGAALGAFIYVVVYLKDTFLSENSSLAPFWIMLPALLLIPILFGSFAAKRFAENKSAPLPQRSQDAAVEYLDTAGPVVMMAVLGVAMLFYWIVSPSWETTLVLLAATLAGVIYYCSFHWSGETDPIDEETADLPRSKTVREALLKNLDIATSMLPASIFMGGLTWLMLDAFTLYMDGGQLVPQKGQVDPLQLIMTVLVGAGLGIGIVIGGIAAALMIAALFFAGIAQLRGMGFGELEMRVKKLNEVLLFGAMARSFHGSLAERDDPPARGNG